MCKNKNPPIQSEDFAFGGTIKKHEMVFLLLLDRKAA